MGHGVPNIIKLGVQNDFTYQKSWVSNSQPFRKPSCLKVSTKLSTL